MKKILFAAEVFGLLAMFPVIIILQINHTTRQSFESNSPSVVKVKTEMTNDCLSEKRKNKTSVISPETLLFKGI